MKKGEWRKGREFEEGGRISYEKGLGKLLTNSLLWISNRPVNDQNLDKYHLNYTSRIHKYYNICMIFLKTKFYF